MKNNKSLKEESVFSILLPTKRSSTNTLNSITTLCRPGPLLTNFNDSKSNHSNCFKGESSDCCIYEKTTNCPKEAMWRLKNKMKKEFSI